MSEDWWGQADVFDLPAHSTLKALGAVSRMLLTSRKYDVVIVGSSRAGNLFAMLNGLLGGGSRPVVMIDCLWYRPRWLFVLWFKRLQYALVSRGVSRFVVWASHEVEDYSRELGIEKEKLVYIPFHHTLEGFEYDTADQGYVFSGGDGDRDYASLISAVEGLPFKLVICTRRPLPEGGAGIPENVEIRPVEPKEFRRLMAGARIVVVPMSGGLLHSGGQQTYLNAMALGKPVVVADDKGAADYIRNGENGIIVPAGDVAAMREALRTLWESEQLRAGMGARARGAYQEYSTSRCLKKLVEIAQDLARA